MTPKRMAELRAACDAATPGPWTSGALYRCHIWAPGGVGDPHAIPVCTVFRREEEDGAFIRLARTALPEALAALEQARAERDEAIRALEEAVAPPEVGGGLVTYWAKCAKKWSDRAGSEGARATRLAGLLLEARERVDGEYPCSKGERLLCRIDAELAALGRKE